jgi:hypothetical protein
MMAKFIVHLYISADLAFVFRAGFLHTHKHSENFRGCFLFQDINPLNLELIPICHLLALLGTHHIFHVTGLRVNVNSL